MTDTKIASFFAKDSHWQAELIALRALLQQAGLNEEWKWSSPVYTHQGHNVAIVWGFKDRAALGFFKGVLLGDPQHILEVPGENSRTSRVINFISVTQIEAQESVLRSYITEAMEKAAVRIDLPKDDLGPPDELTERLAADPDLAQAFDALTPGRRRSWLMHIGQAKQPATRYARIDKAVPRIMAGKGLNDR